MKLPDAVRATIDQEYADNDSWPLHRQAVERIATVAFTEGQKSMRERAMKECLDHNEATAGYLYGAIERLEVE